MTKPRADDVWQGRAEPNVAHSAGWGATALLRRIVMEPFASDTEQTLHVPIVVRERRRRAALLRLVLLSVVTLATLVVMPPALMLGAPPTFVVAIALDVVLACIGLMLLRLDRPTLAASVFIYGAVGVGLLYLAGNAGGVDDLLLLVFATLALLILIAGLVLPRPMIWPTLALVIAVTVVGMLYPPLAPAMSADSREHSARFTALGVLIGLQALAGIISWMSASSARAGMRGADRALERERELAALKDQFIIAANHELRSPIMVMYGNIELLSTLGERATEEQRLRLVERALHSGDAVLTLLTSVLDAAMLESTTPKVTLGEVPLAATVSGVLESFDPRVLGESGLGVGNDNAARTISTDIPTELAVLADATRLRQILVNLISNALKYSPPESPIEISASLAPLPMPRFLDRWRRGTRVPVRMVRIDVRDHGLGVPPRDTAKLFNRFVRLERDIAGAVRGTGIGLYLSRLLVEAMGGRIWVESSGVPGEGSTFSFTLPTAKSLAEPTSESSRVAYAAVPKS